MRRRHLLAVGLLAALVFAAGCTGIGDSIDEERLAEDAEYDWETNATGTIRLSDGEYRAVYEVTNGSAVEVYRRDALGSDQVVRIAAVQFRYPNGTVVGAEGIDVAVENSRVVVTPPADRGKLAYSAAADPKSFSLPVSVKGSYELVLPEGMEISNFLFGDVRPGGYSTSQADGRTVLRWDELTGATIVVRAYLGRDVYIFGGLIAGLAVLSVVGLLYYRLQLRELEREREEAGLDVELDQDDDGGGRPPLR